MGDGGGGGGGAANSTSSQQVALDQVNDLKELLWPSGQESGAKFAEANPFWAEKASGAAASAVAAADKPPAGVELPSADEILVPQGALFDSWMLHAAIKSHGVTAVS
jgi:hypothetical protein